MSARQFIIADDIILKSAMRMSG